MCGARVDVELEDIGAGVVADDVEVELATDDLGAVDFGDEDDFVFEVRAGEEIAEWVDDTTAATSYDRVWIVTKRRAVVGGKIAAAIELIAGEDKAAAFDGDVAHRGVPGITRIGGRRAVEFDALCVHGGAHQRQIIFPPDDRAQ